MKQKTKIIAAARKAVQEAGGQSALADKLAMVKEHGLARDKAYWRIQKWVYNGIPPHFVLTVEKITGVSRYELRPDIYGEAA